MRALDRMSRRARDAAASATPTGTLKRNDSGELVPIDPAPAAAASLAGDAASPTEARNTVREIDNQGYAR